jgi:hypothetical protein
MQAAVHIIVGLLLAIALLYFWLIGHWFARVLVFLVLAGGCRLHRRRQRPAT